MSNPTRQEIIDAHNALKKLGHMAWNGSEDMYDKRLCALWKKQILAALPPKSQPTMAEVEWDENLHFLAEAEQEFYGNVIMLGLANDGFIRFFIPNSSEQHFTMANPKTLTPTGKRYTLTEVQE